MTKAQKKISRPNGLSTSQTIESPELRLVKTVPTNFKQRYRFSYFQRITLLILFILGLLFCSTCYTAGPDVLTASPKEHPSNKLWDKSKRGQLRTLAMLIEMYPDYDIYFLDRDARLLGQTGLVIAQMNNDEPLKNRIHFLNVSRENLKDKLLPDYLQQEGISKEALNQGKKFLFVDTGFVGSIPRAIMSMFPKHEDQFRAHLIVAAPNEVEYRSPFPSTRVFGTEFFEKYPEQDILEGNLDVVHPYAKLPKSDLRSDFYFKKPDGQIVPQSKLGSQDYNDGEISPQKTRILEEDLQHFMRSSNQQLLLDKLRRQWKNAYELWQKGDKPALIKELTQWIHANRPQGLAMALDFMEMNHTNLVGNFTITPDEIGIKPQELNINEVRLKKNGLRLWDRQRCGALIRSLLKRS
jgi:hypothetical protein